MDFTFMDLMLSFVVLSVLLLLGQIIRAKVVPIQKIFLPAAVIAGIIGLVLGPQVLGIIPMPKAASGLPGFLISIFYACVLIGGFPKLEGAATRISKFYLGYAATLSLEIALCMGLVLFVMKEFMPDLPNYIGMTLPIGFYGGHGAAAAIGGAFEDLGYENAVGICMATATIGIISGIVIGMTIVNWAVRKGYTVRKTNVKDLPEEVKTGIIPKSKQPNALGKASVSSETIDPLAFVVALVGAACAIGFVLSELLPMAHPYLGNIPLFVLTLIGGAIVRLLVEKMDLCFLYDETATRRIQGLSLDFLIAAGVATIPLGIVAQYLAPLLILAVATWIAVPVFLLYVGPRLLGEAWFEKMMVIYGTMHGVFATGILLLRVVDPDFETPALLEGGTVVAIDCVLSYALIVILAPVAMESYPMALFLIPLAIVIAALGFSLFSSRRIKGTPA